MTNVVDPSVKRETFLTTEGTGRKLVQIKPGGFFFLQGAASNGVFFLQSGRAKLTVISKAGKEATITLLTAGDFIGEEAIVSAGSLRMATAAAITPCTALRIDRDEMVRVLREDYAFSDFFMRFLLARGMRTQADLIDQLFNSSEKRLARTLLLMAEFGTPGDPETLIPAITQEALAEMIGTTRSRVSFFMNRFRKLGLIDYSYSGRIQVHKSLLNVVLHDEISEQNSKRPTVTAPLGAKATDVVPKKPRRGRKPPPGRTNGMSLGPWHEHCLSNSS